MVGTRNPMPNDNGFCPIPTTFTRLLNRTNLSHVPSPILPILRHLHPYMHSIPCADFQSTSDQHRASMIIRLYLFLFKGQGWYQRNRTLFQGYDGLPGGAVKPLPAWCYRHCEKHYNHRYCGAGHRGRLRQRGGCVGWVYRCCEWVTCASSVFKSSTWSALVRGFWKM